MRKSKPKEGRPPIPGICPYCLDVFRSQRELKDHMPHCPKRGERMTGL